MSKNPSHNIIGTLDEYAITKVDISHNNSHEADHGLDDGIIEMQANLDANQVRTEDGNVLLDMKYSFSSTGAPYYCGELIINGVFSFNENARSEDISTYIREVGIARLYDILSSYLRMITSVGSFGDFLIPPIRQEILETIKVEEQESVY